MKIARIVMPASKSGPQMGYEAKIFLDVGGGVWHEIPGVTKIEISPIVPDDIVRATVEMAVHVEEVFAHPLLGLDALADAAQFHGYRLVKDDG